MSQNMSITVLTILIIAAGFYFMYGGSFSAQKVDLAAFQAQCDKYRDADQGAYKPEELQMLISEINYLVEGEVADIKDPARKNLKTCANELSLKLAKNKS
jgi:hypothetical protein